MKILFKIAVLIGLLAVIALVALFFSFGRIVRAGVETAGPTVTKVPVKLDDASVSVFSGSGSLNGFVVGNPEGFKTPEAIKVGSVSVKLVPSSVLGKKVIVRSVRVEAPEITYESDLKGSNLSKILENVQAFTGSSESKGDSAATTPLQVDEFVITGGKIRLGATILGGRTADVPLPEIRLANLGQGPEGITAAELSAKALGAILDGTVAAVARNSAAAGKQVLDSVKENGASAVEAAKKLGSGVGNLLKGKKE